MHRQDSQLDQVFLQTQRTTSGLHSPLTWDEENTPMEETAPLLSPQRTPNGLSPSPRVRNSIHSPSPSGSSFTSSSSSEDTAIIQAAVFIDDAIHYRSIHHKIDPKSLRLYNIYHSWPVQLVLSSAIFVILVLAFFEYPTSISVSSDFRYRNKTFHLPVHPCGVTESVEILCLLIFLLNCIVQLYLVGRRRFLKQPWVVVYAAMVIISFIDLFISLGFCIGQGQESLGATIRLRRFFRPFFFIVPSSIMKKFIKAVFRTLIRIWSVFILLMLHIYVFAMIGMLAFEVPLTNSTMNASMEYDSLDQGPPLNEAKFAAAEGKKWFSSVEDSLVHLLVFLTTANNPDFMTPIYQYNRFSFLYFFLFLSIGLYLILNLFTAAIFTEFRGFLEQSMQSSFVRRRVGFRAAYAILARNSNSRKGEPSKDLVRRLVHQAKIPKNKKPDIITYLETMSSDSQSFTWKEFREMFDLIAKESSSKSLDNRLKYYSSNKLYSLLQKFTRLSIFHYFTLVMSLIHVAILTIEMEAEYDKVSTRTNSLLACINFFFFIYYTCEQLLMLVGIGLKEFFTTLPYIFDFVITLAIFITELVIIGLFGFPFTQNQSFDIIKYSVCIKVMNMFIVLRLLRVIPLFKSVSLVFGTMFEILKNLRAFAGIFIVIYYIFALLGMELFQNVTSLDVDNPNDSCGSYEGLDYYAYNFHDFAAALVTLWNVMVVNNWYVFLDAFSKATSKWSQLYFIAWWLVSVIISINLFVSLVLEVFITRWEMYHGRGRGAGESSEGGASRGGVMFRNRSDSLQASFASIQSVLPTQSDVRVILRKSLTEPPENELLHELHRHNELL